MGTQQILMIILSVIVVGAAVAVGIQMFDTQADNQTRNALVVESMQMAVQAQAWYRTPQMMGGGGYRASNIDINKIAKYINNNAELNVIDLDGLGVFTLAKGAVTAGSDSTNLTISAVDSAAGGKIRVETSVNLAGKGKDAVQVNPNPDTP